ncbi:UNVERIFIED_CONTAM: hypothetical protein FKN15_059331 [Acipenser sinensis]
MTCKGASQCSGAAVAQCGQLVLILQLTVWDFNSPFLTCDCALRWVPGFFRSRAARLSEETLCAYPSSLQGKPLHGALELHTLSLLPSLQQVVFQGDRLPLQCTAALLDNSTSVRWRHNGHSVTSDPEAGVWLEDSVLHDCTLVTSELILSSVRVAANGKWECVVSTERGNVSRSVEIVVLDSSTSYCVAERVTNNRGDFRWPRTLAGITAFQPCLQYPFGSTSTNGGASEKRALRHCNREGRWEEGDYGQCLYTSDITRGLYTFVLMPINASNALTLALQLRVYTAEAAGFTDTVDVLYVAQMMEKFIGYAEQIRELSEVILDMVSNMLQVDELVLWRAQKEERACSSIVQSLERIAGLRLHRNAQDLSMAPCFSVLADGCSMWTLSDPVTVSLRHSSPGSDPVAAHWSFEAVDGQGGWIQEGCQLTHSDPNISTLRCTDFSNYAVLQELSDYSSQPQSPMEVLHPVIYTCTAILLLCLFTVIITHILHRSARVIYKEAVWQCPRQPEGEQATPTQRPMLSCWLVWRPSLGAFYVPAAFAVLVSWVYFLCTLSSLWGRGDGGRKELPAASTSSSSSSSSISTCSPTPEACRSSLLSSDSVEGGAVHARPALEDQHSLRARFMAVVCTHVLFIALWSLGALAVWRGGGEGALLFSCLYGITAVALGLFLLVHHCIRRRDVQAHWLACCCCPSRRARLMQAYLHVLFIALWSLGALAVWRGGGEEALLFSCLYGITAVALGLFLLVHHCIRRRDVQAHWLACCCCPSRQARLMQAYLGPAPLESTPTNSSPSLSNPGPCKLTNLLQVTQSTSGAPGGNSSGNGNVSSVCCSLANNHSKHSNNNPQQQHPLLPIIGTTAQHCIRRRDVQAHWLACCCCPSRQARLMQAYLGPAPLESTPTNSSPSLSNPGPCKLTNLLQPGGRSKQTATLYHHRGWEGKPHHRIKVIKGGALELLPSTHHTQRPAPSSSESGSLPNSHSESRASPLPNSHSESRASPLPNSHSESRASPLPNSHSESRASPLPNSHSESRASPLPNSHSESRASPLPNSHSESRASPLPNSHSESRASPLCSSHREAPGEASTSPSEGSDGGGSGRQKPFPLVLLSSTRAPTVPCQGAQRRSVSRDNLKTAASPEREAKRSSYPLNMAVLPPAPPSTHNGFQLDLSPMAPSAGVEGMRGGVWKSETTV